MISISRPETFSTFQIVSLGNYLVKGNGYIFMSPDSYHQINSQDISLFKNKQKEEDEGKMTGLLSPCKVKFLGSSPRLDLS